LEPGANPPVDEFPFLRYIPARWSLWKRRAFESGQAMDAIWSKARRLVEERRRDGYARDSIADRLLDEYSEKGFPMTQHAFENLLGELVEGGAETTSSSMLTLFRLLAKHPEVQEKARSQIDAVCGTER
jgi:cytochrome P450